MSDQSQSSSSSPASSSSNYPCSCGLGDGTGQYIKCDNDDCPVSWYHWECVHVTEEPAGTWLCPKCSPNASFYVKQLVKKRPALPPPPKTGKVAASKPPNGKESRSTSAKAATAPPTPAKNKAQKQEANTKNEDGNPVKKGVAIKKPMQKKPKPKFKGWVELPSDEEEELKRKVDAEWAMENVVTGQRRRSSRLAAEENETSWYGLRPRVGGLRPRVEKKEIVKTDSSESSVGKENSDEDESVYEEEVEEDEDENEDEDEDEDEEESSVERKKSVTGNTSNDSSPDTNMEEDEDEGQFDYQEEEDDSDNYEGNPEDEGSSLSSPAAVPRTPSVVSISSTSHSSSSFDTMDVDGDLTPRQSDINSQTPSSSNREVNDEEYDDDEDEHSAEPPATSPSEEDSEDSMDIVQEVHEPVSSNGSDSDYRPPSNPENGSDNEDVVSISSDTPTITPRTTNRVDLTSPEVTPASPSINILRDGDMETDDSSEEHGPQAGTPGSPCVIILRSPFSDDEHEPPPTSPSVIILRDREMTTDESEHEDPVFVTVTPAVQFNPYAASYANRVEFLDNFPDSADRSTLPRLG
ncbi:hypothetical protein BDR22DRAFT_889576 [Usnea florida]